MPDTPTFAVGDWIAYYRAGVLCYSPVRYIRPQSCWPWGTDLLTEHGVVAAVDAVEVRHA